MKTGIDKSHATRLTHPTQCNHYRVERGVRRYCADFRGHRDGVHHDHTGKEWFTLSRIEMRALRLLAKQRNLVGPGYFGELLWPKIRGSARNCSAPLARSAGKLLNRLRSKNLVDYEHQNPRNGQRGWSITWYGKLHLRRSRRA